MPGNGWILKTGLTSFEVVAGRTVILGHSAGFDIAADNCRRLTLAFPLFAALMLAPPRPRHLAGRVLAGFIGLAVLFALSVSAVAFCHLAQLANHAAACDSDMPPFQVAMPAYGSAAFFLARFGYEAALMFLPLLAPAVLWLALNPAARMVFLDLGRSPRRRAPDR